MQSISINFGMSDFVRYGNTPYEDYQFSILKNKNLQILPPCAIAKNKKPQSGKAKNFSDVRRRVHTELTEITIPLESQYSDESSIKLIYIPELKKWVAFIFRTWIEGSHRPDFTYEGPYEPNGYCNSVILQLSKSN